MQSCAAACPYGWQWVPNWPDGSYFWMAAPAVEGTSLYVIGERISPSAGEAGEVEGEYTARFTVGAGDALTYQGIIALTGAAGESQWGSATPDPGGRGWWLTGTRNTGGTGCVADCKAMDTAYVPLTAMTHPSAWHVQLGVLPSVLVERCSVQLLPCSTIPIPVFGRQQFTEISTGFGNHTCGVTTRGNLYCWGLGVSGQRGDGTASLVATIPILVREPASP